MCTAMPAKSEPVLSTIAASTSPITNAYATHNICPCSAPKTAACNIAATHAGMARFSRVYTSPRNTVSSAMGANITVESIGISPEESIMEALWLYSSQTSSLIGRMSKAKVISTAKHMPIMLSGTYVSAGMGEAFTANAMELIHSEAGVLNMLELSEDMGPLLNSRVITITARGSVSGLTVPLDAIGYKDGAGIITIENGEGNYDVQIDIIASDEDNAIIRARDGETALSEGMRYKKP